MITWVSQRYYFETGLGLPLCDEHIETARKIDPSGEVRPMAGETHCAYCRTGKHPVHERRDDSTIAWTGSIAV